MFELYFECFCEVGTPELPVKMNIRLHLLGHYTKVLQYQQPLGQELQIQTQIKIQIQTQIHKYTITQKCFSTKPLGQDKHAEKSLREKYSQLKNLTKILKSKLDNVPLCETQMKTLQKCDTM